MSAADEIRQAAKALRESMWDLGVATAVSAIEFRRAREALEAAGVDGTEATEAGP